ncbi:AAA family ATPase [Saccharopolyspora sp. MS10]|uniref:AAA family ATPase n=1 Tax=Saccharopolyspora sp. MS10 TaxID=3385973 RepID=UPI00399FAA5C
MQEIIGREAKLADLRRLVGDGGRALIVTGDPGAGKTTLLDAVAGPGALRATGSESEAELAFAGLHQLLAPLLRRTEVPARLLAAFGLVEQRGEPDVMRLGLDVLGLLSADGAVLVVDDAQWFDRASLDVLGFLARRLGEEPISLLIGARDDQPPPGLDGLPVLRLEPLDDLAANRLLDALPQPPTGARRLRVLAEAAGNPLALTEFATTAQEPEPGPLMATARLEAIFAARADGLPAEVRDRLLVLAAAESTDRAPLPGGGWEPAERAGLVRRTGSRVRFRHPLVRSALYHSAPFGHRRRAHLLLAEAAREEPDRRAWHLAAAATGPDADVAAQLEATADRARTRGGYAAAARALERAAELSPDRAERGRRLVLAADSALFTAQAGWVRDLAERAAECTEDPALLAVAALRTGQALAVTTRHAAAFAQLLRTGTDQARRDPVTALEALGTAAVVGYYAPRPGRREQVLAALDGIPGPQDPVRRCWVLAVADPEGNRAELLAALAALDATELGPAQAVAAGTVAWLLDETALAVRLFERAFDQWRVRGPLPDGLGCAHGWALVDQGSWSRAQAVAAESASNAVRAGLPHVLAGAEAMDAAVLALRGDTGTATRLATEALSRVDPAESVMVAVRARYALGMAAAAGGDHAEALAQFGRAFTADGAPAHHHQSWAALPEFAAAAARLGTPDVAAPAVRHAGERLRHDGSPRTRALVEHARAMLAEDPGPHFTAALADPATEQWPFDRARAQLHQAEWLRRSRRIAEARAPLAAALETFRRLGARPWAARAEAELRASGGGAPAPAAPGVLEGLSPQQQEIIRLAARGLTNREIGDRLFLSPRTVGSHLHRAFPKLGVSTRHQLRDLIDR